MISVSYATMSPNGVSPKPGQAHHEFRPSSRRLLAQDRRRPHPVRRLSAHCKLHEGQRGACFVRMRDGDELVLTTYGRSSGFCIDPIEKKQNAVLRRAINKDVQKLVRQLHGKQADRYWSLFCSRGPGSFDFRGAWSGPSSPNTLPMANSTPTTHGSSPREVPGMRSGLCEDRAVLLAGLLLAAGISSFNVRVALGDIEFTTAGKVTPRPHVGHV